MQTLATAFLDTKYTGDPIQMPYPSLNDIDFRTGELAMLAGAPGGGKTLFATNWAINTSDPLIYFAQEHPHSIKSRLAALALDKFVSEIKDADPDYWYERLTEHKRASLIQVPAPTTVVEIEHYIIAYEEWWMSRPRLIFLDNIKDMKVEGFHHQETGYWATLLPELKNLAQEENVGIVGLHHVGRGDADDGTKRISMTDLLHSGERDARHVWGVYRDAWRDRINFQVLKQTDGPSDWETRFDWDAQRGRLWSR